ncbi:tRNA (adenosine(37)-N6)-threonylcarbamoyltransferase complex ATPase subunit type 1 TsaE [Bacillus sp. WMMC1349]|uniref:tRNA (adenosine(37)-N6)-threonylcarbamoyltransferase complex ATPase subunit type 1 TsaE n=1 Tax=Bacillus sp. WMMC1349 TaxID=2736254 RepID=UPI0015517EED|nr:tRNA (adenosine(37)-N6)-threonylcarbamoyltransferase complex ATPase subunit type 1 TsaE [Bacillus sp. WMMC1349]NPC91670.1 tRNA (adenosine(37)-N6)-threonylcarbamoyltransferase complex ATPase subunit type 1 TsaE [Bacillus sp. WMMC1349]
MNILEWHTTKPEETKKIGERTASLVKAGDVITLEGDLGAGKTTFTKGFAEGLGIRRIVNSPTFNIIKEYRDGILPLFHMDVYRMEDSFEDLGLDEYFEGDGVCLVEWAHLIHEQLPKERLEIVINRLNGNERKLTFSPKGARYDILCKELSEYDNTCD